MEQQSPSTLGRSTSLPSRPPPAIATDPSSSLTRPKPSIATKPPSSITRPYRLSPSSPKGVAAASPPTLLQRRANASQGLSEVKASHVEREPPLPPPRIPPPPAPSSNPPSAYEVLHVHPSATQQEIREAYRRLARQHHPDKAPLDLKEASSIVFLQIHAAYVALKDPEARAHYDRQMSLQSSQGLPVTPRYCAPSPRVFTPRSQVYTPKGFTGAPYFYTPRSQVYTPNFPTADEPSSNVATPRTPFSARKNWETDQCW